MILALFGSVLDFRHKERLSLFLELLYKKECLIYIYDGLYTSLKNILDPDLMSLITYKSSLYIYTNKEKLPENLDLFMSLGGDGTFLESIAILQDNKTPIAGINFGRLGFLTTASFNINEDNLWIDRLFNGDYRVEKRSLLKLESDHIPKDMYPYALNEISVQRTDVSMLNILLKVDDMELPAYWSDGLLISTPTGSTAYSLSVGGPVVQPSSKVLVVSPIAPHNLNVRPLVVSEDVHFELSFYSRSGSAQISIDNKFFAVPSGTKVKISLSRYHINYVCLNKLGFIEALQEKLLWGEDRRNSISQNL